MSKFGPVKSKLLDNAEFDADVLDWKSAFCVILVQNSIFFVSSEIWYIGFKFAQFNAGFFLFETGNFFFGKTDLNLSKPLQVFV